MLKENSLFCVGTTNDMLEMDTRDLTINGEYLPPVHLLGEVRA